MSELPDLGCERALLLQGPAGPFFRRFAEDLRDAGVEVTKVNLHAGDALFFPGRDALSYRGTGEGFGPWLRALMEERRIDGIFLFGDCRAHHRAAIELARERGAAVWVFEEGYLRPDYITLERDGVNGYSRMPRDPDFYREAAARLPEPEPPRPVGPSFAISAVYSTMNALAYTLGRPAFPHYAHHRPLNAWAHTAWWVRGAARKAWFELRERGAVEGLVASGRPYFFVPLQVHCDFQLLHSPYDDVTDFMREVVAAFAEHAPPDHLLVLKHHPMDRPFREYGPFVRELAAAHGLGDRLRYVHDVHLPTLLKHARGTITINSTVGLSSIHHGTPVKVTGTAVYDLPGLTHQGDLASFLRAPSPVDPGLYEAYRRYLLATNQVNGNVYRRLPGHRRGAGLRWGARCAVAPPDPPRESKANGSGRRRP